MEDLIHPPPIFGSPRAQGELALLNFTCAKYDAPSIGIEVARVIWITCRFGYIETVVFWNIRWALITVFLKSLNLGMIWIRVVLSGWISEDSDFDQNSDLLPKSDIRSGKNNYLNHPKICCSQNHPYPNLTRIRAFQNSITRMIQLSRAWKNEGDEISEPVSDSMYI